MPCTDGGIPHNTPSAAQKRADEATAVVCALHQELLKIDVDVDTLYINASNNGQVNVKRFIKRHVQEDTERLKKDLSKYSSHELTMLRELLRV